MPVRTHIVHTPEEDSPGTKFPRQRILIPYLIYSIFKQIPDFERQTPAWEDISVGHNRKSIIPTEHIAPICLSSGLIRQKRVLYKKHSR